VANADEHATTSSPPSKKAPTPIEIVANRDFISWKYPPYCELCNVRFSGENPAEIHFKSEKKHRNRLQLWKQYHHVESMSSSTQLENESNTKATSNKVLCDICWKQMDTQKILDTHCLSPAHLDEKKRRESVQKLKEEYKQMKASISNSST